MELTPKIVGDEMIKFDDLDKLVDFYYTHQLTQSGDHFVVPCDIK
jgi:hypothetical protein